MMSNNKSDEVHYKTVLVTGGAGFIGSHLVRALLAKGYKVRVLDNLSYGRIEWIPEGADFMNGDICDFEVCRKAAKGVNGVFHLAAMSRSGPSINLLDVCTQTNIIGTENILKAAREFGVKKVIYSGSSTYYGSREIPHMEYETSSDFLNFYSLTKKVGEDYCLMFDKLFDIHSVIFRYFNVYGPNQPQEGAYALVLGIFLKRWAEGSPLIIHGDGSQRRDFIHVRDVVQANIMAYESKLRNSVLNVGSGFNFSIKEIASLISDDHLYASSRPGDAKATLADITRIKKELSWRPTISLEEGIEEMKNRIKLGLESL